MAQGSETGCRVVAHFTDGRVLAGENHVPLERVAQVVEQRRAVHLFRWPPADLDEIFKISVGADVVGGVFADCGLDDAY